MVSTNTNLGMILLLTPLAAVPPLIDLANGIEPVLAGTTRDDARLVYQAIRLAAPGGIGRVDEQDVADEPTMTLRDVMALAADRDLVARQYASGFQEVLQRSAADDPCGRAAAGNRWRRRSSPRFWARWPVIPIP